MPMAIGEVVTTNIMAEDISLSPSSCSINYLEYFGTFFFFSKQAVVFQGLIKLGNVQTLLNARS